MNEILFKSADLFSGQESDKQESLFDVQDIFQERVLATGLHKIMQPLALTIAPKDLYAEIRQIALGRFGLELPNDQKRLLCLQTVNTKTALLRDLCKAIGVKLEYNPQREFLMGNKTKQIVTYYNEKMQKDQ